MPQIKPEIETFARIKVIGVGGAGSAAINRMVDYWGFDRTTAKNEVERIADWQGDLKTYITSLIKNHRQWFGGKGSNFDNAKGSNKRKMLIDFGKAFYRELRGIEEAGRYLGIPIEEAKAVKHSGEENVKKNPFKKKTVEEERVYISKHTEPRVLKYLTIGDKISFKPDDDTANTVGRIKDIYGGGLDGTSTKIWIETEQGDLITIDRDDLKTKESTVEESIDFEALAEKLLENNIKFSVGRRNTSDDYWQKFIDLPTKDQKVVADITETFKEIENALVVNGSLKFIREYDTKSIKCNSPL